VAAVLAGAGVLAGAAGVTEVAAAVLAGAGVAAGSPLSWLQAASASRAAHRIGRRLNMTTSNR
jgi:hypothetical protein